MKSREILFLGKQRDNGEWIIGYYLVVDSISYILPEKYFLNGIVEVDQSTLGQYTGLTDKNGKKIFEGDILEWDEREWGETHFDVVTWDYDLLAMRAKDWGEFCVVCGNVYDNPELLEKKEALPMTREEAINRLEEHTEYCVPVDDLSAFEMAVDALRTQQTPLDRSRWDGCHYCDGKETVMELDWIYGIDHILPDYKFCPMCGRPLTEEAWAELERRINGGTVDLLE